MLSASLGFFAPASAEAPSVNPFDNTKWVSTVHDQGSHSTVVFGANGKWSEDWRTEHHEGLWWSNKALTLLFVKRDDGRRLEFKARADHTLFREVGNIIYVQVATDDMSAPSADATPSAQPEHNATTVKLTEDQARAVVLIKGDNGEGTGFLVKTKDGPAVFTNQHVLANNPNLKITTTTGAELTILSYRGATDRDLAMIVIKDGPYHYLTLATDVGGTVQPGDEVITPGNSQGGGVMLNTDGKVLGIGPDRIEFDNPVYHGNSGGPVFHVKSGKVIGVVTEAMKVDTTNEFDKASFANHNSAIHHSIRYFGLRIDTIRNWEPLDWQRFQVETAFLDAFDQRNECLYIYLNAPDDNKPEDTAWTKDAKMFQAATDYFNQVSGDADAGQKADARRIFVAALRDIVNSDLAAIENPANFYAFDRQRAKDSLAYRKALKVELDGIGDNVDRLNSLPRSNQ